MATLNNNKRASAEWEGNFAGLTLLLVMATVIVAYVLLVSPAERERLQITPEKYARTLLDVTPGLVSASAAELNSAEFNFGTMSLDYSVQTFTEALKSQLTAKRSAYADSSVKVPVSIKQTAESVVLEAVGSDKTGSSSNGALIVYLNGKEIFSGTPAINEKLRVPLSLLQANSNLEFAVSSPGLKFWQTNSYSLVNVNIVTSTYDVAKSATSQTFTLTGEQAGGLASAKLEGYVRRISDRAANIKIKINGKEVFSGAKEGSLDVQVPEGQLKSGVNSIEFIAEKDGAYKLTFSKLSIEYSKVPAAAKKYNFFVNDYNFGQIQQGGLNCVLKAIKEFGANSVNVKLNTHNLKLGFANGVSEENICPYLIAGDNTLALTADADISLSSLNIAVSAKQ